MLKIFKSIIFLLIIIALVGFGLYKNQNNRYASLVIKTAQPILSFAQSKLPNNLSFSFSQVKFDQDQIQSDWSDLSENAQSSLNETKKVLGTAIEVDEQNKDKSPQDRAFAVGQYLYCKQVVESWENR